MMMETILSLVILILLFAAGVAIHRTKDLLVAIIMFSSFSFLMAVLWLVLQAPDVALTEAAIGSGITTLLFLAVLSKTKRYTR
jgi:energy-converting hydrogenase B subunit D